MTLHDNDSDSGTMRAHSKGYCQLLSATVLCLAVSFASFDGAASIEQSWTYTLLGFFANTSDESAFKTDLHVDRISRSEFAFTGSIKLDFDMGHDTEVEVLFFFSATGSSDYKQTAFAIHRQSIYKAMNVFYRKYVMKSLAECSNLPQFEGNIEPPLKRQVFEIKKCQVSVDAFPTYLAEGYYKVVVNGYGPVQFYSETLVQVQNKVY